MEEVPLEPGLLVKIVMFFILLSSESRCMYSCEVEFASTVLWAQRPECKGFLFSFSFSISFSLKENVSCSLQYLYNSRDGLEFCS